MTQLFCQRCATQGPAHDIDQCARNLYRVNNLPTALRVLADFLYTLRGDFALGSRHEREITAVTLSLHEIASWLLGDAL